MNRMKPKEQHERLLAKNDTEKIVQHLDSGREIEITLLSLALARQCDLYIHFKRLWTMRVADLEARLNTERYMKNIYTNKRTLWKELNRPAH